MIGVLESVAEYAIQPDVSESDQPKRDEKRLVLPPANSNEGSRQRRAVREVVQPRPEARAAQIAEHRQVGNQQRKRDQPPALAGPGVGEQRPGDEHGALDAKP